MAGVYALKASTHSIVTTSSSGCIGVGIGSIQRVCEPTGNNPYIEIPIRSIPLGDVVALLKSNLIVDNSNCFS